LSFINELKRRNVLRVAAAYVVAAWLVIQVVETIFPVYGLSDASIRIVITMLAIGLVPTLIFAWVFELTPEGLKKETEVDRSQSIAPRTGRKLDRVIMVVLALALGYFAFDKFVLESQKLASLEEQKNAEVAKARQEGRTEGLVESYGDKSIAVLPFVNMSSDVEQEYFSDGISEELLNLLAAIPKLRVISRSSAFSYKGKDIKLAQVAEELNVAHILEGSVRKAGNEVRITAQLIDARSDTHLWSETYDRTLENIFAIQDEISAAVVEQLKITLLGAAPRVQETNPEAYALYLQARYLGRQLTAESFEQSIALYQQVLSIDPGYAAAWSGIATSYINQAAYNMRPRDEGFALARDAVDKALALEPDYARAIENLGWIAMTYDRDLAVAVRHYERALDLDPADISIIRGAAALLANLGRQEQSIALGEYVIARDPVNPKGHFNLGLSYYHAGRWDDAIASFRTVQRLSPAVTAPDFRISQSLLFKGEAEAALAEPVRDKAENLVKLVITHYALGNMPASGAALGELIKEHGTSMYYFIAGVLAYRNEADRAFEWLEKAVVHGGINSQVAAESLFNNIHNDPRWLPFLESIGKSPEKLAAIEFKVTLPK
jgi:TolB-like protein/lipoprotein NlpI